MIPKKAKRQKMKYSDDKRIKQARKNVAAGYSCYTRNPTNETQEELNQKKGALEEVYSIIFGEELDQKVTQIEQSNRTNKHQESWKLLNEITGRKTARRAILKGRTIEERVKNWHGYFKELLGKPPKIINENENIYNVLDENELNIKTGPFTNSEYENVRKQIKENKGTGPDGISPEVLKRCEINDILIGFANKILINHEKLTQLGESDMIPIPKMGDLSLPSNHRGIPLSSIVTRTINRMILNRIQPKVDPHLRFTQNGFRPGISSTAHILALRRLIEGVKERNLKAILVFIDFKKAFDSIHRDKMLRTLRAYGLPDQLVSTIGILYIVQKLKFYHQMGRQSFLKH